jgi:hypothetical protein
MPLTPVGLTAVLIPSLLGSGNIGIAVPQLALGVANGVCAFTQSATVVSADVGVLGTGASSFPVNIPQALILASLLTGFAAAQVVGPMAPLLVAGLTAGLSSGFPQGLFVVAHAGVGVGTGITKVIGSGSAVAPMIAGFASAGMMGSGATKQATAIGIALDIIFGSFVIPLPILGSPSTSPGTGVGVGKIV